MCRTHTATQKKCSFSECYLRQNVGTNTVSVIFFSRFVILKQNLEWIYFQIMAQFSIWHYIKTQHSTVDLWKSTNSIYSFLLTSAIAPSSPAVEQLGQLFIIHIKKLIQINTSIRKLLESSLLLERFQIRRAHVSHGAWVDRKRADSAKRKLYL